MGQVVCTPIHLSITVVKWTWSFEAWQTALACIPAQDPTAAQTALQAKFREGLKLSKAAKANPPPPQPSRLVAVPVGRVNEGLVQMPWVRAAALEKEILAAQEESSAIIILFSSRAGGFHFPPCAHSRGPRHSKKASRV